MACSTPAGLRAKMRQFFCNVQATAAAAFEGRAIPDEAAQALHQLQERFAAWQSRVETLAAKVRGHLCRKNSPHLQLLVVSQQKHSSERLLMITKAAAFASHQASLCLQGIVESMVSALTAARGSDPICLCVMTGASALPEVLCQWPQGNSCLMQLLSCCSLQSCLCIHVELIVFQQAL